MLSMPVRANACVSMLVTSAGMVMLLRFPLGNAALSAAANQILMTFAYLNALLMIFNLIPIPPLDGSRLLTTWLPYKARAFLHQIEQYGIIVLFLIIQIIYPLIRWLQDLIINGIFSMLYSLFF